MIRSFRHKGLELFFVTGDKRGLDAKLTGKLGRLLSVLNTAEAPEDLRVPAHRLHQLRGDRLGHGRCG
jgi:proteic killer suppression protein